MDLNDNLIDSLSGLIKVNAFDLITFLFLRVL